MKTAISFQLSAVSFVLALSTSAVDVPVVTKGVAVVEQAATFDAVRISSLTLVRVGADQLQAVASYVQVGSVTNLVNGTNGVRRLTGAPITVTLDSAKLALVIADYAAQRAAVLALMAPGITSLTARVDGAGHVTAEIPTLMDGAYRLVRRDEAWLLARGVDCAKIKVGVKLLVANLQ